MKWFFGVVVLLNLFAALWGSLKSHPQMDIHAQEVSPHSIRLLPADWGEGKLAPRSDAASAAINVKPEAGATKLVANLDPGISSALLNKPQEASATAKSELKAEPSKVALPKAELQTVAKTEAKPLVKAEFKVPAKSEAKPAQVVQKDACFHWAELDAKTLGKVKQELAVLKVKAVEHARQASGGKFWVYVAAKPNAADTHKAAADLKAKGFDNYAVQNDGEFKGALSLGLFGKEEGATAFLEKLKIAGFADAHISQRGGALTSLSLTGLNPQQVEALNTLQRRMAPSVALKSVSCS